MNPVKDNDTCVDQDNLVLEKVKQQLATMGRSHCTVETLVRGMSIARSDAERLLDRMIKGGVLAANRELPGHRILIAPAPVEVTSVQAQDEDAKAPVSPGSAMQTPPDPANPADVPQCRLTRRIENVGLDLIDQEPLFALRQQRDADAVQDYSLDMQRGDVLPRVVLARIGDRYRTVDGDQRCAAARLAGLETIEAYIVEGDQHELLVEAIQGNRKNGVRLKRDELKGVLDRCLADPVLRQWSNVVLARLIGVSDQTVGRRRKDLDLDNVEDEQRKQIRQGKVVNSKKPKRGGKSGGKPRKKANATAEQAQARISGLGSELARIDDNLVKTLLQVRPNAAEGLRQLISTLRGTADKLEHLLNAAADSASAEPVSNA